MPGLWQGDRAVAGGRDRRRSAGAGTGVGPDPLPPATARVRLLRRGISEGLRPARLDRAGGAALRHRGRPVRPAARPDRRLRLGTAAGGAGQRPDAAPVRASHPGGRLRCECWGTTGGLAASLGHGAAAALPADRLAAAASAGALALAVSTALSLGDLGVIALVRSQDTGPCRSCSITARQLPHGEATVIALWLILLTVGVFVAIERLGGGRADR